MLRRLEGLPGQHLFQFVDEAGEPHSITSDDINAYIREATGGDFTAKDFRTWAATVLAVVELSRLEPATSETVRKRGLAKAIRQVAARLGNTPAVCRSSYIHPDIPASYLTEACRRRQRSSKSRPMPTAPACSPASAPFCASCAG